MYKQNVKNQREEKSASSKKEPTFFLYNVACRIKLRFRDFIRIVARTDNLELSDGASGLPFPISWTKETIVAEKVGSSLVSRVTGWFPFLYATLQRRRNTDCASASGRRMPFHGASVGLAAIWRFPEWFPGILFSSRSFVSVKGRGGRQGSTFRHNETWKSFHIGVRTEHFGRKGTQSWLLKITRRILLN